MIDQNDYNRKLIEEFRTTRNATGRPLEGRPVLLLTTTGAKSGRRYTTPVMCLREGDRLFVVASNAGAPRHPNWYHNLVAHPDITVEVGTETFTATAVVLGGTERERIWTWITAQHPFFTDHQAKITRQFQSSSWSDETEASRIG